MGNGSAVQNPAVSRAGKKIKLLLIYLIFVFANISVNRIVKAFDLPLYVDNIGTLLGAVLGGYLPGIFVGYITNVINATADITNLYYAGISVLIAVSATFMARRGMYEKFWKALLTVPVLAFMGGGIGSVLTYGLYGSEIGFRAQIFYDFKIDLIDKLITVVCFYGIKKLIPEKVAQSFEFTDWRQKPLSRRQIKQATTSSRKGLSLRNRIILIISVIMVFVGVFTTAISYYIYHNSAMHYFTETGRSAAKMVAQNINGDRVREYLSEGGTAEDYLETKELLREILDDSDYIEYVYSYIPESDGFRVVFDLDSEDVRGDEIDSVIAYDDDYDKVIPALLKGEKVEPFVTVDKYGWLIVSMEPVYDSDGNFVCYGCADVNMHDIRTSGMVFLAKILSLFTGIFILVLGICMWFSEYHLTFPIDAMAFVAGEFAYNSDESLDTSVEKLKGLEIKTGDEIENLYNVLTKTIGDTVGYLEDVEKKGEQIANMQNGLIYIMADLVESRDKNTGDHVKKTAAYVKLILDILREQGLYTDMITDEYYKDVCNSAPLHDVGKIKVSDVILNKPGKLTDEEFAQMKRHTIAGKEVVERAMEISKDTGYLKEALNLATYHHEKWDGSGYPTGLKGEEIPLSARIMAVSDVFDALVSARSYKKPFEFDEAMKIIEEGEGKHFDPVIAKLFVENADRVREIAEEHKRTIG